MVSDHASAEHRTNSGALVMTCCCGWRTPPHGVRSLDKDGNTVSILDSIRDQLLREWSAHAHAARAAASNADADR